MTSTSRGSTVARGAGLLVLTALALGGCGGTSSTPLDTAPRTVTRTVTASPTPSATVTTPAATPTEDRPSSHAAQVVKVAKYGISFELPKGWITLDAKNVLKKGGSNSPFLDELARRLGTTPDQLIKTFSHEVQTMSVSDAGAVNGFVENVNTVGEQLDLNDDQIKLQLATVGAKPGAVTHASTDAGGLTRVPYRLDTRTGITMRAVALAVHVDGATVVITVSSTSAAGANRIADQIQASVKRYDGPSNNA